MDTAIVRCTRVSDAMGELGQAGPEKYAGSEVLPFRQAWLGLDALPRERGQARVGCSARGLWFYTWLEDSDIFSGATAHDQKMWTLGDVVEFFVKPGLSRPDYWEIHVTPNGYLMDLYIEDRAAFLEKRTPFEAALAHRSQALFATAAFPDQHAWSVEICLPWPALGVQGPPDPGTRWQFAVCRYNCTGTVDDKELSSVAPFTVLSFHRYEEFLQLQF